MLLEGQAPQVRGVLLGCGGVVLKMHDEREELRPGGRHSNKQHREESEIEIVRRPNLQAAARVEGSQVNGSVCPMIRKQETSDQETAENKEEIHAASTERKPDACGQKGKFVGRPLEGGVGAEDQQHSDAPEDIQLGEPTTAGAA